MCSVCRTRETLHLLNELNLVNLWNAYPHRRSNAFQAVALSIPIDLEVEFSTPFPLKTPSFCFSPPFAKLPEIMPPFSRENTTAVCQPNALSRFAHVYLRRRRERKEHCTAPLKGFVPIELELCSLSFAGFSLLCDVARRESYNFLLSHGLVISVPTKSIFIFHRFII